MSLPRKDLHVYLDADIAAALKVIADLEGEAATAWVEKVITDVIKKRVHSARLVMDAVSAIGETRIFKDEA